MMLGVVEGKSPHLMMILSDLMAFVGPDRISMSDMNGTHWKIGLYPLIDQQVATEKHHY